MSEARAKLASLMDKAVEDAEEIRITRRGKPDVVLISADELDSWKETAYLLRSPANAERLLAAIERAQRSEGMVVSDADFQAMKREIEALGDQPGGTSPTLERLIRSYEAATEAKAATESNVAG